MNELHFLLLYLTVFFCNLAHSFHFHLLLSFIDSCHFSSLLHSFCCLSVAPFTCQSSSHLPFLTSTQLSLFQSRPFTHFHLPSQVFYFIHPSIRAPFTLHAPACSFTTHRFPFHFSPALLFVLGGFRSLLTTQSIIFSLSNLLSHCGLYRHLFNHQVLLCVLVSVHPSHVLTSIPSPSYWQERSTPRLLIP